MEGIVIKTTPYQESSRILTLFTQEEGIISVMARKIGKKNLSLLNVTSILSLSEFQFFKKNSDFYYLKDATLLDSFLELRGDLNKLKAGGKLLKAILHSQYPGNPTNLYLLLKSFLYKLKTSQNPSRLVMTFYCKLLKYEGVLPESKTDSPIPFSDNHWELLHSLSNITHFSALEKLSIPTEFEESINNFFYSTL